MKKRLKVIFNPVAGSGVAKTRINRVIDNFKNYGSEVDIFETKKKGDALRFARDKNTNISAVIAMGGDGTINEVVNGLQTQNVTLGIIPGGTSNLLAHEMGIPSSVDKACNIINRGKIYRMDLGYDSNRYFCLMAGIGIDAEVVNVLDSCRKGNISFATYLLPIIRTIIKYDYPGIAVTVDGKDVAKDAAYVFVSNVKSYIGPVKFTYLAKSNDGKFDICIIKGKGKYKIPKYVFGAVTRTLRSFADVIYLRGNEVDVFSDSKVLYQLDGDPGGCLPGNFILKHKAVKLLVP